MYVQLQRPPAMAADHQRVPGFGLPMDHCGSGPKRRSCPNNTKPLNPVFLLFHLFFVQRTYDSGKDFVHPICFIIVRLHDRL